MTASNCDRLTETLNHFAMWLTLSLIFAYFEFRGQYTEFILLLPAYFSSVNLCQCYSRVNKKKGG